MVVGLPYTPAVGVYKPPEGVVFKRHRAEGSGKRLCMTESGACIEAE